MNDVSSNFALGAYEQPHITKLGVAQKMNALSEPYGTTIETYFLKLIASNQSSYGRQVRQACVDPIGNNSFGLFCDRSEKKFYMFPTGRIEESDCITLRARVCDVRQVVPNVIVHGQSLRTPLTGQTYEVKFVTTFVDVKIIRNCGGKKL